MSDKEKVDNNEVEKDIIKEENKKVGVIESIVENEEDNEIEENKKEENNLEEKKKFFLISIVSAIVILILLILSTGFALFNINNNTICLGVKIDGEKMQGLTKEQAVKKLTNIIEEKSQKNVKLKIKDNEYEISAEQIELQYSFMDVLEEAYNTGKGKNIFINNLEIVKSMIFGTNLYIENEYNDELLEKRIEDIAVKLPTAVIESAYFIEGERLIITKGAAGDSVDKEETKKLIINKIKDNDGSYIILNTIFIEPQEIDIDKIYKEVYKEPKDASYVEEPFQVIPHIDGIDFDIEAARKILEEDKEEYEIPLVITKPKITTNKIGIKAFPNLLSSYTTKYDSSLAGRTTNLKIAASKINEIVVLPGETFSYNKTLGKRTIEQGYKEGAGYAGGKVVQTLGGGICQISSTLYDAVLYANLGIVERWNHMFLTSYVTAGKDATVSYGSLDFKFKNTRKYPIMIKASVSNGVAKVEIYGVKEEVEYEVEIETKILSYIPYTVKYEENSSLEPGTEKVVQGAMTGCKSITYKILKLNGVQISKVVLSNDTYDSMNRIIERGPKKTITPDPEPLPNPDPTPTPSPDPDPDPTPSPDPDPDPIPDPDTNTIPDTSGNTI